MLGGFVAIIYALKLIPRGIEVVTVSNRALADLRNRELDDYAKEVAMQSHAKRLFALFLLLLFGGALALILPLGIIYLLEVGGILSFQAVIDTTISWEFLVPTTVVSLIVLWWLISRNVGILGCRQQRGTPVPHRHGLIRQHFQGLMTLPKRRSRQLRGERSIS